jgi:hypothetical protein
VTAAACWQAFCILTDCDGVDHVDATGYSWDQERGTAYCPEHRTYDRCAGGPVFTDYERGQQ